MIEVTASYFESAALVAFAFVIAFVAGLALKRGSRRTRLLFYFFGALLIGIAVLEKIGWSVHLWVAGSPAETWDDLLFRVLFLAGLGFWVASWTAAFLLAGSGEPARTREAPRPSNIRSETDRIA